ncbi:MAG TPA: ABC transporter permease [Bacillota bacterium]|nr:ABC transporter permease [Bacillota bacterium]
MGTLVVRRLAQLVPTLAVVSMLVFSLIHLIPGNPAYVMLGAQATPGQIAALTRAMGLDRPLPVQYWIWVQHILRGDLGQSYINGFPVAKLLALKFPATFALAVGALVLAVGAGVPAGVLAAVRPGSWIDRAVLTAASLGMGVPTFWLGILLILAFSISLHWLPPSGYTAFASNPLQSLRDLTLPAITLGVWEGALLARFARGATSEALSQLYVRTARAKGLPGHRVLWRHAVRNALIPLLTVFGIQFGGLLGGAVITEAVFDWPGVGRLLVTSILERDYQVVQAVILVAVVVFLMVNLVTDLTYGLADPRVRLH